MNFTSLLDYRTCQLTSCNNNNNKHLYRRLYELLDSVNKVHTVRTSQLYGSNSHISK